MSNSKSRRESECHLSRTQRKKVRKRLMEVWGNRCCWCDGPMVMPEKGKNVKNYEEMATIEHHFAKEAGEPGNIMFFRLAHTKCNR